MPSMWHRTGNGLHLIWCLSETLEADAWEQDAGRLKLLMFGQGLVIDPQGTVRDKGARVCGPDWQNYRQPAQPCQTSVVYQQEQRIKAVTWRNWMGQYSHLQVVAGTTHAARGGINSEFAIAPTKPNLSVAVTECNVLAQMIATGGKGIDYHGWNMAIMQLAKHDDMDQGLAWAQSASQSWDGWDAADVKAKFEGHVKEANYASITCAKMATAHPQFGAWCASCAYLGKVATSAGIRAPAATTTVTMQANGTTGVVHQFRQPTTPRTDSVIAGLYENTPRGVVYRAIEGLDDVWPGMAVDDLEGFATYERSDLCVEMQFTARHIGRGSTSRVVLSNVEVAVGQTARNVLARCGVVPTDVVFKNKVMPMLHTFYDELQNNRRETLRPRVAALGWQPDNSFVTGELRLLPDGSRQTMHPPDKWRPYAAHGDRVRSLALPTQLLQHDQRAAVHAMFAAVLAAPLWRLTGQSGVTINFQSPGTGTGKTTAGDAALSLFGNPDALRSSANDTKAAIQVKLGNAPNLPHLVDDPNASAEDVKEMLFRVNTGQGRSRRQSQTEELQGSSEWKTIMLMLSNHSLEDLIGSTYHGGADLARFLEFTVEPITSTALSGSALDTQRTVLREHNGHFGRTFLSKLVPIQDGVRDAIATRHDKLALRYGGSAIAMRFQLWAGAAMLFAAQAAQRMKLPIDPKLVQQALDAALVKAADQQVSAKVQATLDEVIDGFLAINVPRCLHTHRNNGVAATHNHMIPPTGFSHEINRSDKTLVIALDEFRKHIVAQKHGNAALMAEAAAMGYRRERRRLGDGAWEGQPSRDCLVIDTAGTRWEAMSRLPAKP